MNTRIFEQPLAPGLQLVAAGWAGKCQDDEDISPIVREISAEYGAVSFDLSDCGMFEALWNIGQESGLGLEVEAALIPILQETIEQCEKRELNPYRLPSRGCFVIAVSDGYGISRALRGRSIYANVIGHLTRSNDRIVIFQDHIQYLGSDCTTKGENNARKDSKLHREKCQDRSS